MTDTVNIPLLRKAIEWAEVEATKPRNLREWEQGFFVLPHTEEEARAIGITLDKWWMEVRDTKAEGCGTCYCIAGYIASLSDVRLTYTGASEVAREALGITTNQSYALFSGGNTITDVRRIAEEIAGERL